MRISRFLLTDTRRPLETTSYLPGAVTTISVVERWLGKSWLGHQYREYSSWLWDQGREGRVGWAVWGGGKLRRVRGEPWYVIEIGTSRPGSKTGLRKTSRMPPSWWK